MRKYLDRPAFLIIIEAASLMISALCVVEDMSDVAFWLVGFAIYVRLM